MGGIFISYRREDTGPYAGRLRDKLSSHFGAEQVFRDLDRISPGERFPQAIDRALGSCDALVALIGPTWSTAGDEKGRRRLDDPKDYLRIEIAAALARPDVLVIPVLIGSTPMPRPDDLPEPLVALSECNALRLTDEGWDDQVLRLVTALEAVVRTEPVAPPDPTPWGQPRRPAWEAPAPGPRWSPSPPPPAPPPGRGWALPLGAAVVVLLLLGGLTVVAAKAVFDSGGGSGTSTTVGSQIPPPSSGPATTAPATTAPGSSGPADPFEDFGPGNPLIALSPTSGPPGTSVRVTGTGFGKAETVDIRFHASEVGTTVTRADGSFSVTVTVPATPFRNAQRDITATGKRTIRSDSAPFMVR